jgi:light-harvesting complex 1 beta chain
MRFGAGTSPHVVASAAAAQVARVGRSAGLTAILLKEHRMSNHPNSISGLTNEEAQEFHHYWIQGTVGFTAVAVVAHILVWAWRPWFV